LTGGLGGFGGGLSSGIGTGIDTLGLGLGLSHGFLSNGSLEIPGVSFGGTAPFGGTTPVGEESSLPVTSLSGLMAGKGGLFDNLLRFIVSC